MNIQMHARKIIGSGMVIIALAMSPSFAIAHDDSLGLFQKRCAPCHGKTGQGKSSTKAPSLVSEKVKGMSDERIRELILSRANGEMERDPAHTALKKRLTESEITEIISAIRKLQEGHK